MGRPFMVAPVSSLLVLSPMCLVNICSSGTWAIVQKHLIPFSICFLYYSYILSDHSCKNYPYIPNLNDANLVLWHWITVTIQLYRMRYAVSNRILGPLTNFGLLKEETNNPLQVWKTAEAHFPAHSNLARGGEVFSTDSFFSPSRVHVGVQHLRFYGLRE